MTFQTAKMVSEQRHKQKPVLEESENT